MKTIIEQLTEVQKQQKASQQDHIAAASMKHQQENNIIQQLKSIVSDKERKVKQLEQDLLQLKHTKIQESQMNSVNALFDRPASVRSDRGHSRPGTANGTALPPHDEEEVINDNTTLSPSPPPTGSPTHHGRVKSRPSTGKEVPTKSKSRPTSGSHRFAPTESRPSSKRNSRPSTASNQAEVLRAEEREELVIQCQEHKSIAQAAEVERDKLMELIKVLQNRLDECNDQSLLYQNEMKAHKQNAVKLEKTIGKMKLESGKSSSSGPRKREQSTLSFGSSSDVRGNLPVDKLQELEGALILQRDENEALKAALESTLKAKEEDLRMYNDMVEQTKLVFLQGLRQIRGRAS